MRGGKGITREEILRERTYGGRAGTKCRGGTV